MIKGKESQAIGRRVIKTSRYPLAPDEDVRRLTRTMNTRFTSGEKIAVGEDGGRCARGRTVWGRGRDQEDHESRGRDGQQSACNPRVPKAQNKLLGASCLACSIFGARRNHDTWSEIVRIDNRANKTSTPTSRRTKQASARRWFARIQRQRKLCKAGGHEKNHRSLVFGFSSPRPPHRRGKATTKNGEENKHSDSPNPVDDTQTVTVTGSTTTSTNTVHPSVNDMDWFAGVAEEDLLYYTGVGNDVDSLWAVIGSFVPPPPRPPYLPEESIATDGLTTCDLCSWAWRNDRHSFSLDGTLASSSRKTTSVLSSHTSVHIRTEGYSSYTHSTMFATYLFVKQLFQSSTCFRIWEDPSRTNVNEGSL
ncbi:hypothetical protein ALC62_05089 [Cyphomyrmex costatus]|uniref:Uncharacterized protein n=1 Tax=Cyphomyrmex costatus TaxID=456900 RepID=A0A195CUG5_9HYME|nr:hypothetical protein ALC62_05089 [Cyphomyrmex costatus]